LANKDLYITPQHCKHVPWCCELVVLVATCVRQGYGGFIVSHVLGDVRSNNLLSCGIALSPVTDFEFCGDSRSFSLYLNSGNK